MNSIIQNSLIAIFVLLFVGMQWSCKTHAENIDGIQTQVASQFPKYLERNANIGPGAERERMHNVYVELTRSLAENPNDAKRLLQLTRLYMLEARATGEHGHYYPAALKMIDASMSLGLSSDKRFEALSLKGSVLLSLHQFEKARKVAKEAIAINGYNAQIYGVLVDANVELGNYEKAVEMSDKMNSMRPDLRSYSRVSYLREIHGEIEGSIQAMELAINASPAGYESTAWAANTLGDIFQQYGELDKAKEIYKRILVERDNYPFAVAALGEIAEKEGDFQMAEKYYKDAIAIIPEVGFYQSLAGLYQKQDKVKEVERLRDEILLMLIDDEKAGHVMGLAYVEVYRDLFSDYDKAMKYAMKEYLARPLNIEVNLEVAALHLLMGEPEKAIPFVKVAMRTASKNPDLLLVAGLAHTQTGDLKEGMKMMKEAYKTNPHIAHPLCETAIAYVGR